MRIDNILSKWQLVPLYFALDTVGNSVTDSALFTTDANASASLNLGYTMPFDGEIIAISANLSAAASTGTLTIDATDDTVATTDPSVVITTQTALSDKCNRGTNAFAKNAVIGASYTTTGWNGTASDLQVIVWVLLKVAAI